MGGGHDAHIQALMFEQDEEGITPCVSITPFLTFSLASSPTEPFWRWVA